MIVYPHTLENRIRSFGGNVFNKKFGFASNPNRAHLQIRFESWLFNAWFDFETQTARSPVYWYNKKPKGSFQMTIGHDKMSISDFLKEMQHIVTTNTLSIENWIDYTKSKE